MAIEKNISILGLGLPISARDTIGLPMVELNDLLSKHELKSVSKKRLHICYCKQ